MHGLSRRRRTLNFMIWDVVTPDKKETFFKMPNNQIEIALATFHLKSAIVAKNLCTRTRCRVGGVANWT